MSSPSSLDSLTLGPPSDSQTKSESPPKTHLISLIIPVYNEYHQIRKVLNQVLSAPLPDGFAKELIVIDDGSSDGTTEILRALEDPCIKTIHCPRNAGKGAAIRLGLKQASGGIIVIQDGDNEYNPAEIRLLVEPIANRQALVVYGSRFLGKIEEMRWPYWLVNKLLIAAVWLLYQVRITDEATAYKAFHHSVIQNIPLNCRRFEFCPEITAKVIRKGIRIHEVPITYGARTIAEGKKNSGPGCCSGVLDAPALSLVELSPCDIYNCDPF
jgi:glycosyltransferase involved in cell wall biosynthesis